MRYRKERAEVICREIKNLWTVQSSGLEVLQMKDGLYWSPTEADQADAPWVIFNASSDIWSGKNRNSWFKTTFTVPEEYGGKPISLTFRTQADGWDASNPQFLLYVNGKAFCGMDTNHTEVLLTEKSKAGDVYRLDLQGFTGSETDELKLALKIVEVSLPVIELYYDIMTALDIIGRLDPNDKIRIDLETAVERVINVIDLRESHSAAFSDSVHKALSVSKKEIYENLSGHNDIIATCVGQTHLDVAWWWTVAQTRQKAVRSFATALKLMDDYPEYTFMSSQPQLYQFVKEDQPELYERIKTRIKEGRWEAEGGMWLEADCNLTSGESLIRQFIYGKRFFKNEFGIDSRLLWLPDVFGYSAALPQIMKLCGVDSFMTTKLSWNQFNRIPYDTFMWRGIDGSKVFTHMITTTGAANPLEQYYTTYNGVLRPNDVMGAWERYQQKEINNDVLVAYGYGDGGGGSTPEMVEYGKRLAKGVTGAPKVRFLSAGEYFNELRDKLQENPRLPKWVGELYFEYHRGTYTSMARNKRANRKSELLLQDLEFVSVLADGLMPYPKAEITKMWETVLLNQFHDILPGSSIKEVYEVTKQEYADLSVKANALLNQRLEALAADAPGDVVIFNTLGFLRNDTIIMDIDAEALTMAADDNASPAEIYVFPCQKTYDGKTVASIRNMPSKGYVCMKAVNAPVMENPIIINGFSITTPNYRAEFNDAGDISRLLYTQAGNNREVLVQPSEFRAYEDKPMKWDNWDIDVYYTEKSWKADSPARMEWLEKGPVRAALLIERTFMKSVIRQHVYFYADSSRIDFETFIDWKEDQVLLKARFFTDIKTPYAAYDIQFGNVTRPTHFNTSWDQAMFEICAHKWADLSEGNFGLSVLNDCKYGHSIHDGVIGLTLLKSGNSPNPDADREEHFFTYSLLPHTGSEWIDHTAREAYSLNSPAYAIKAGKSKGIPYKSLINAYSPGIMVETVKRAEDRDSVIVRMYEFMNKRGETVIDIFGRPAKEVYITDALENRLELIAENADTFTVKYKPYEIKTLELVY